MNGFPEMLKSLRLRDGLTQSELGAKIGMGKSCISMWEAGQRRPSQDKLEFLADVFNVNLDTLLGRASTSYIPLLGRIACGSPIVAEQNVEEYISLPSGVKADYALTCRGQSMIGAGIQEGDIVFIRQDARVENGQIAAVLIGDNATLKHVHQTEAGIMLTADNPTVPPKLITDPETAGVRVLGLAVAYLHKLI